jgi:hypothetical protein
MAKRQVVSYNYTCDVCGGVIPESEGYSATRKISWESSDYVVDVCDTHVTELDEILVQLKTFAVAGSRSSGRRGRKPGGAAVTAAPRARSAAGTSTPSASPKRGDLGAVRAWARENGRNVSERGRIPAALLEAYDAANNGSAATEESPAPSVEDATPAVAATPRKARGRRAGAAKSAAPKRNDLGVVRAWARENGLNVSERGRIPAALLEAYAAATNGSVATEDAPAAAPRKRAARKAAPARKRAARKTVAADAS